MMIRDEEGTPHEQAPVASGVETEEVAVSNQHPSTDKDELDSDAPTVVGDSVVLYFVGPYCSLYFGWGSRVYGRP